MCIRDSVEAVSAVAGDVFIGVFFFFFLYVLLFTNDD